MSREVPSGWSESQIDAVADMNPESLRSNTSVDYRLKYIDVATVDGPSSMLEPRPMNFGEAPSRARKRVKRGDILVSTVRPYLRSFCQVLAREPDLVASTAFAVLRPKPPVDGDFLYQHVLSEKFVEHLTPRMKGSNYPAVTASDVGAYPFLLPPLHEQRRIAEILSSVDEAIATTRAVIEQTRKVKQGVLEHLLTKGISHTRFTQTAIGEIPEGWLLESIGQIANVKAGATPSRALHDRYFAGGHIPWVKTGDLTNGEIAETEEMITEAAVAESSCEVHPAGTVLVAMYGGFQQIGRSGILTRPSATNQAISALRLRDQTVMGAYLNLALVGLRPKWRTVAASSRKDPNITKDDVLCFKVPVPPLEEQQQIVELMAGAEKCQQVLDGELLRLMGCKSALMSDLLTGRKRITDAVPMAAE